MKIIKYLIFLCLSLILIVGCLPVDSNKINKEKETKETNNLSKVPLGPEIASIPNSKIYLYGLNTKGDSYKKILLKIDQKYKYLNVNNVTNPTYSPELILEKIKNREILILILTTQVGSGLHIEEVHAFDLGTLKEVPIDSPLEAVKGSFKSVIKAKGINIEVNNQDVFIYQKDINAERKNWFSSIGFGDTIDIAVEDNVLKATLGAQISPADFIGEIILSYKFEKGKYQVDRINFVKY